MSSAKEGRAEYTAGRFRANPGPIHHSGAITGPIKLSHSGPIKLSTGPTMGYSGPLKILPKGFPGPSIIPADVVGKKKPPGYDAQEPMSPKVNCLGRVRITQNHLKGKREVTDKNQLSDGKRMFMKKKETSASLGKLKQSAWSQTCAGTRLATEQQVSLKRETLDLDLGRFGSACGVFASIPSEASITRRERGAMLAASLIHLVRENSMQSRESTASEYVPQVPPPNSLLLMRRRIVEPQSEQAKFEEPQQQVSEKALPEIGKNAIIQRHVSLPKPPAESKIWNRRGIAAPFVLDVRRPIKLEVKQPITG